jgi:hypothetical protein
VVGRIDRDAIDALPSLSAALHASIRTANQQGSIRRNRPALRTRRRHEGGKPKNIFVAKFSDSESTSALLDAAGRVAQADRSIS